MCRGHKECAGDIEDVQGTQITLPVFFLMSFEAKELFVKTHLNTLLFYFHLWVFQGTQGTIQASPTGDAGDGTPMSGCA